MRESRTEARCVLKLGCISTLASSTLQWPSRRPRGPIASKLFSQIARPVPRLSCLGSQLSNTKRDCNRWFLSCRRRPPMQVYLAQKMVDCMWWLSTYNIAKHSASVETMITILKLDADEEEDWPVVQCLRSLDWNNALVFEAAQQWGHNVQSLHALATTRSRDPLLNLEQLSVIRTKTLHQTSYEALVSRPILQERLKLQNQLMSRDLGALELPRTGNTS